MAPILKQVIFDGGAVVPCECGDEEVFVTYRLVLAGGCPFDRRVAYCERCEKPRYYYDPGVGWSDDSLAQVIDHDKGVDSP